MRQRLLHITTVDLTAYCFLRSKLKHFREHGYEVALATTFQDFRSDLEPVCDFCFDVSIPRRIQPWGDLKALLQLMALIRGYRPHLVHTYTSKAGLLGRLAARICRVPVVVHTIYELPQNSTRNPWLKALYRALERLAALWCDWFVTISKPNLEQIAVEKICPADQLELIREGLDFDHYQPQLPASTLRQQWHLPPGAQVLGIAGRLEPAKGHGDLLRAVALLKPEFPDLHLVVMGRGHLRSALEQQTRELGIADRVHFLGWIEDLVSSLAALDLFVLSSHYEGLGVVLLEALALGVPVVSTRVGGAQDIVEHEVTGLFAPAHDPEGLASAIRRMLLDPELARATALRGQQRVRQKFQARVADQLSLELYQRLLSRRE